MKLHVKSTCRRCWLTLDMDGDDATEVLAEIDKAHDILRPRCEATIERKTK